MRGFLSSIFKSALALFIAGAVPLPEALLRFVFHLETKRPFIGL
jgi:hypothetical protein